MMRWPGQSAAMLGLMLALTGCGGGGGGGGGGVNSTPTATPTPTPMATPTPSPTPSPSPTPAAFFDTAEYDRSTNVGYHGALSAYTKGWTGKGVTVGVVDTGISDPTGEFAGRISSASKGFGSNTSYDDVYGHGTAVAATIAAARNNRHSMGVAWAANIMALRTEDAGNCSADSCTHPTTAIASAIDHAWQNGARIINVSLGGGTAPGHLLQAVGRATAAGTIIVVAAGNNPDGGAPLTAPDDLARSIADPTYSNGLVIITPSVNTNGAVSSFSAGVRGYEAISLAGMGNAVRTIDHTGTDFFYSGTSFAAPQISGAAALLAEAFPNLTGKQIVDLLLTTARDAGPTGADAQYGRGILDIAAAFAPTGAMTVAGSRVAVTPDMSSDLSSPMGDARPTGAGVIALDQLNRAYEIDMSRGFAGRGPTHALASAIDMTQRHVDFGTSAVRLALSITPGNALPASFGLPMRDEERAQFRSGTISARISRRTGIALGINSSTMALERHLAGRTGPSFLMAEHGFDAQRADMRAGSAMALSQLIGRGLSFIGGVETGDMTPPIRRPNSPNPLAEKRTPYHALAMSVALERGPLMLSSGLTLLHEPASALGARFSPTIGGQSAQTLFARLGVSIEPADRLTLTTSWQRGWTRAAAGGTLPNGGTLVSQSWSADVARRDLVARGDMVGVRISQPLRVIASKFDLVLPDRWDWETGVATNRIVPLDLVPRGRQRDYELSYGRNVGRGRLTANLFLREENGNIDAMPTEHGAALRWSLGF